MGVSRGAGLGWRQRGRRGKGTGRAAVVVKVEGERLGDRGKFVHGVGG